VRPATPDDIDALATLTGEMNRYYGATDVEPLDLRRRQIRDALFGDVPAAYVLLATDAGSAVGFAAYSFLWPAVGLTRSLYLKELYITQARHHSGVGRQIMESLFELASEHDCSRVEWTTDQDNPGAQAFYETLGVDPKTSKLFYRLERTQTFDPLPTRRQPGL
jgi:GNAT superfamily N-acetyltransferase